MSWLAGGGPADHETWRKLWHKHNAHYIDRKHANRPTVSSSADSTAATDHMDQHGVDDNITWIRIIISSILLLLLL